MPDTPPLIEPGVYDIPLQLDASLEPGRPALRETLMAAQRRLREFARKHGWEAHVQQPFAVQAHIYAAKPGFDHDLLAISGMDTTIELPETYCAALENYVLMSVSPELYQRLFPEGNETGAFEKLLTHEMAHRLHIRILKGDEDAMGPVWFYEGFALVAASQFEHHAPRLSEEEIWEVVGAEERGSYIRYASVLRTFLGKADLQRLVEMAGKPDFVDWLRTLL
jgi:hypothetical protein